MTHIDGPWRHLDVHANGIRFHVVEASPTTPPTGMMSEALSRTVVPNPASFNFAVACSVVIPAIAGTDE